MDIIQFRHDPPLLGSRPHMRQPESQRRWDVLLKVAYGLPLDDGELAIFSEHTGRRTPRPGGYPEAVVITGRQSGKTQVAGDILAFEAATAPQDGAAGTYALAVAQDQRGSMRTLLRYATAPFEHVPMLARELSGQRTADSLTLRNGVSIAAYPCRPAAIRGIRARVVILDELAFYRTSDGNPVDTEMLRAVRPTLATTGGKLIVLSSPYGQTGALWDLHRQHYGREESATLVWVASAPAMNPTLPADYLARMEQDDPEAYRSEVLGEFRAGIATFLDPDALAACVAERRDLLPVPGIAYKGFYDASGGARDAAAAAIAHRDGERVVIDVVRAWPAPHDPKAVIAEASMLFHSYGVRTIQSDRYAGEFPTVEFLTKQITNTLCPLDRSALYLGMLPHILATAVELPNDPALLRELRGLERRRGFAGKDRVDHRPGAHDDRAVVLAGAVYLTAVNRQQGGGEATKVGFGSGGGNGMYASGGERRPPVYLPTAPPQTGPWRYGDVRPCPLPAHIRRTR